MSMEDARPAHNQSTHLPPVPNPLPPPSSQPPLPPKPRKRPRDAAASLRSSDYFKFRALLKDLRPHFIEVLRTPDFRNCKAAQEIREQHKLLLDLCGKITAADSTPSVKINNGPLPLPLGSNSSVKSSETKPAEKQEPELEARGTYIVGGSAFGWNFITFPGDKPVYYGMTKESFRTAQAKL